MGMIHGFKRRKSKTRLNRASTVIENPKKILENLDEAIDKP